MDIIIRRKILKFAIIIAFVFTLIFLVGCSDTGNTLETISINMDKVINDINKVESIENSTLIIDDFIDQNNLQFYDIDSPALYQTNNKIDNYVLKIKLLNNSIYNTIEINDHINALKKQIIAKAHQVKSLCTQCIEESCKIDNNIIDTLEELNNNIMSYTSRTYLSRNEVKNHIQSINQIKDQYSSKSEQLATRYEKLQGSLNTRLSYYININEGLNSIAYAISTNSGCDNCYKDCCIDCQKQTTNEKKIDEQTITTNTEKSESKWLKKNIDTYENAGKDIYGFNKKMPTYNKDNYLNGYGYFNYPNFYPNGFGGYGYGNIYNSGFGMPYNFGYGMTYPNINTFGAYKNIDTYKFQPNQYLEKNREYDIEKNIKEENDEQATETSSTKRESDILDNKQTPKLPKPLMSEDGENAIKDNPPPPMTKPYIPPFSEKEPRNSDNDVNLTETQAEPKTLEYIEEDILDDDDKFVAAKPNIPNVEKL